MAKKKENVIEVYTDGSCLTNGNGGWGFFIKFPNGKKAAGGGNAPRTTAPAMEVTAVVEALKALPEPSNIHLISDCEYVVKGVNKWLDGWEKNNYKTSSKKQVAHSDKWKKIKELKGFHKKIKCTHVPAHSDKSPNENLMVDILAKSEALKVNT